MRFFKAEPPKVIVLQHAVGKRVLSLNEFIEDKLAAKAYAKEFVHVAPNRLKFMDRVTIWEGIYIPMRQKEGWVLIKGGRNDGDRFRVEWSVDDVVVVAEQDEWDGTVTERVKKKRSKS
jgi:hypothetical protein